MIQATIVTIATAQCWQKALNRAIAEALDVYVGTEGEAFVESSSTPGLLYSVSREHCSCPAGQRGIPCKHRACYLAQCGELPLPEIGRCPSCTGGKIEEWCCGHVIGGRPCSVCGGTGRAPADAWPAATRAEVAAARVEIAA